jgi:hypothetical protein
MILRSFDQYFESSQTYFEREHPSRRLVRTLPNTEVGNSQIPLARQWVLFPLEIQATISETTLGNLTIIKGSPDRPVVFCKN